MAVYPMVSIIIPVYNGSNYLREAIMTAMNQIYPNIEILVINDGSCDEGKTREIAQLFGNKIRYFEKENGGVASALNMGVQQMQGEYFSWLSHDDRYRAGKISDQMAIINNLQDKTTIIYGGYDLINESGQVFYQVNPLLTWTKEELERPLFPIFKALINGCTLLIHRSHFERTGGFDERLLVSQDMDLWFRMFRHAKLFYQNQINVETRVFEKTRNFTQEVQDKEINDGWIKRMHSVTVKEMEETMISPVQFYAGIAEALKCFESYKPAYNEARRLQASYSK